MDEEELVASMIDICVISSTTFTFILRASGWQANSLAFRFMRSPSLIIVVRDVAELATQGNQFCFGIVLLKFVSARDLGKSYLRQS